MEWCDGDVVRLCQCRELTNLSDSVAGEVGAKNVDHILSEQVLEVGRATHSAAETERGCTLRGDLSNSRKIGQLARFVHPQRVQALERGAQNRCVARSERGTTIDHEI